MKLSAETFSQLLMICYESSYHIKFYSYSSIHGNETKLYHINGNCKVLHILKVLTSAILYWRCISCTIKYATLFSYNYIHNYVLTFYLHSLKGCYLIDDIVGCHKIHLSIDTPNVLVIRKRRCLTRPDLGVLVGPMMLLLGVYICYI